MQYYLILALLFAIMVSVFAIQNSHPVQIQFLIWELKQISQVLVIFISVCTGAIIAILASLGKQFKLRRQVRQLTQENNQLKKQLADNTKSEALKTDYVEDNKYDDNVNENN